MHPIKKLKHKKYRDQARQFVIEGEKQVGDIPLDWTVCMYACSQSYAGRRDVSAYQKRAPLDVFRDAIFDGLTDTIAPQGILAVCKQKSYDLSRLLTPDAFLLIGEGLNDPGNIGAIIRTAAAAGATGVVLTQNSGEIYNPKVVRASAGTLLNIPVVTHAVLDDALALCKQQGILICAAHPQGAIYPYSLDLHKACAILVGNETHGLTPQAVCRADYLVKLPMPGKAESLNASIAGSILLYEAVRQRLTKGANQP
jgi:TrmH family RNA methyltransferase